MRRGRKKKTLFIRHKPVITLLTTYVTQIAVNLQWPADLLYVTHSLRMTVVGSTRAGTVGQVTFSSDRVCYLIILTMLFIGMNISPKKFQI